MPHKHIPRDAYCPCPKCLKLRLVYALNVGRNRGDISKKDLEIGIVIITTMLSVEEVNEQR